jgi:tetratricopeptide (TPR) repeat protein
MHKRRSKRLNLKVALLLPIVLAILAGGGYGLHQLQVGRTARKMLDRAKQAQADGKLDDAIRYYEYYLRYEPARNDVFTTLALLMADQAKTSTNSRVQAGAHQRLEAAAIRDPENMEILRRLADSSLQLGQYAPAIEHLRRLIKRFPKESELEVKLGRALAATEHYPEAATSFRTAIGHSPQQIEAYVALAVLLREKLDDREAADETINQMVSANASSPQAYVERAKYWRATKRATEAKADLVVALKKGPNDREVLLTAAEFALNDKEVDKAKEYLQRANERFPDDPLVQQALADLYRSQNDPQNYRKYQELALSKTSDPLALARVAEAQLATKDVEAVRKTIARMKQIGYSADVRDYYEARILLAEGKLPEAVAVLERLRPRFQSLPQMVLQIDLHLGACYEQLRLPDRQLEAYRRAMAAEPTLLVARVGYASALLRTGKTAQALEEYRRLRQTMGDAQFFKTANLCDSLFQLLLVRNARLPEKQRDWKEAEELLVQADKAGVLNDTQRAMMQGELLMRKGQAKQARELIAGVQKLHPKDLGLWTAMASIVAAAEGPRQALAVLDAAGKELGNSLALEISRLNLAMRWGPKDGKPVLDAVGARVAALPAADQLVVWQALGAVYHQFLDRPKTKEMWSRVVAARPKDPRLRLALCDLAREANDPQGMAEAAEAIKQALGAHSAEWCYCEVSRLVWQVQHHKTDAGVLEEARKLLKTAAELRPTWHEIPRLEGEVALLEGRVDDAIGAFQRANDLGTLSPAYLGQLARLLFVRARYSEAKLVLDQLGPGRSSPLMEKIEAEVSQRLGQTDEALKLAAENVAGSTNAGDYFWYGQLLARAGKADEAAKAYRRAIALEPKAAEVYLELVSLLARTDRTSEAEAVIRQAQSQLPEDRRPLILAECYQLLGKADLAEQSYQDALARQPKDLVLLRRTAEFYLRAGRNDRAKKYLDQLLELAAADPKGASETIGWARRALAQVMADSGDYQQQQQALALLEQNASQGKLGPQDRRVQAIVLAQSADASARLKAIAILESLQSEGITLGAEEQFVLAQLYERTDRWDRCHELMLDLLAQSPKESRYLAQYIQMLVAHGATLDELTPWLQRLEQLQPNLALAKVAKARVLAKAGRSEEAAKLLESLLPSPLPLDKVAYLREVAQLLEEIQQYASARKLLTEFAEKTPGGSLSLAAFLGRHGSADEALDQCEAAIKDVAVAAVLPTAVNVLRSQGDKAQPKDFQRVETWFQRALNEKADAKSVQLQLASLRDLQNRYEDLIKIYREFLARDDLSNRERAVVWNNLAYVLVASGKSVGEAGEMIDRAIKIVGPTPDLLDTRGLVRLGLGKTPEAIADFRQAIAEKPSGVKHFHLALAHLAAGDREAARGALKVAQKSHHLTIDEVPRLEREKYRKLLDDLPTK